MSDIRGLAD